MKMKRRKFVISLGTLTVGSSSILGSGAFSQMSAARSVSISTAKDYEAYLALEEVGSGGRSVNDGSTVRFSIPGVFEETEATGVGTDSIYRFSSDANAGPRSGLFTVQNQGSQSVKIYSTQKNTSGVPTVKIFDVKTGELLTESNPSDSLGVGDSPLYCGLQINTYGADAKDSEYTIDLNIHADATRD